MQYYTYFSELCFQYIVKIYLNVVQFKLSVGLCIINAVENQMLRGFFLIVRTVFEIIIRLYNCLYKPNTPRHIKCEKNKYIEFYNIGNKSTLIIQRNSSILLLDLICKKK